MLMAFSRFLDVSEAATAGVEAEASVMVSSGAVVVDEVVSGAKAVFEVKAAEAVVASGAGEGKVASSEGAVEVV